MDNNHSLEKSTYFAKKRVRQIEDTASALLAEFDQISPPINVNFIRESKGLSLQEIDFEDDISGVFMSNGQSASIGINKHNSSRRQRFTIAHELGHYILGHRREQVFVDTPAKYYTILFRDKDSSSGEFFQEREANAFAAALLMPRDMILHELHKIYDNQNHLDEEFDLIGKLSQVFDVSKSAMTFRLTNLDLHW